jgi:subfamily B ATP-binding cassette protein HlyB/CyaB
LSEHRVVDKLTLFQGAYVSSSSDHEEGWISTSGPDSGLQCFVNLLGFLGRPADPEQLRHAMGIGAVEATTDDLLRLARRMDVKARARTASIDKLARHPLPAIARLASGRYVLVLQASRESVLLFHANAEHPQVLPLAEFAAIWSGELILMTTREHVAGAKRAFDITWFIPALVRYRHLLRDVLIASFFLNLLGLITPLFFQVVVDKVLVHKGLTTLEVLAFGLFVVAIFEVLVGGLRTYLFSHTTSRVDAELGSKLFAHLTHLPLA